MADCKIINGRIIAAIERIGGSEQGQLSGIAKEYEIAGITLINALNVAIADMEGDTKNALQKFFDKDVAQFVTTDLPAAINGLSMLLEESRRNFENVDKQIAASISEYNIY